MNESVIFIWLLVTSVDASSENEAYAQLSFFVIYFKFVFLENIFQKLQEMMAVHLLWLSKNSVSIK